MSAAIVTETRGLPGAVESAAYARRFVREALAAVGCPDSTDAELCASELVANSAKHSLSSGPKGTILLRVDAWRGGARVEVRDAGPRQPTAAVPVVPEAEPRLDAESARGLWLVGQIADTFGFTPGVAWCQFSWPGGTAVPTLPPVAVGPVRHARRRSGRLVRAAHRLVLWRYRQYGALPAARDARGLIGMPWRHPEYLTRSAGHRARSLDALAERLWPNCEYMRELL
jgi:anti-sigma regulatory factor (Ser/Thr protein kinase)